MVRLILDHWPPLWRLIAGNLRSFLRHHHHAALASAAPARSERHLRPVNVSGATTQGAVSKFITGVLKFKSSCICHRRHLAVGENRMPPTPFAPLYAGSYATNADGSITLSLTLQKGGTAPEIYAIGYSPAFDEAMGAEMDSIRQSPPSTCKPQTPPGGYAVPASYTNASNRKERVHLASCCRQHCQLYRSQQLHV